MQRGGNCQQFGRRQLPIKLRTLSTASTAVEVQAPIARLYAGTLLLPTLCIWLREYSVLMKSPYSTTPLRRQAGDPDKRQIEGDLIGESSSSVQVRPFAVPTHFRILCVL